MLLLDKEHMLELMKSFYALTNMAMSVLDRTGQCIIGYPTDTTCPFCHLMQQDPHFMQQCMKCNEEHFDIARATGKPHRYTCHAGLMEMISPVERDGAVICYIQLGQVLEKKDAHLQRMHIFDYAHHRFGRDGSELARTINLLPTISEEKYIAYQTLFEAITKYLFSNQVVALSEAEFINRLDEYIDQHIDQRITLADLCQYFQMSRSPFYETLNRHLHIPLTTYIRKKRIHHAQALLRQKENSITSVALAAGFDDYSYFCRVFKQVTGLTPREYRHKNAD